MKHNVDIQTVEHTSAETALSLERNGILLTGLVGLGYARLLEISEPLGAVWRTATRIWCRGHTYLK